MKKPILDWERVSVIFALDYAACLQLAKRQSSSLIFS